MYIRSSVEVCDGRTQADGSVNQSVSIPVINDF